jgi:hypothetical protein
MAGHAWEEAPVDFRPRGMGRLAALGRWLVRLFVIGALTLGAAFYLPLYRAHRALTVNHALVLDKSRALERDLARARSDLSRAQAAQAELETKNEEARSRVTVKTTHLDGALSAARAKLQRFLDRKIFSLALREERLVVSFSPAVVQGLETSPAPVLAARLGLCDIVTALANVAGTHAVDVMAYADSSVPALAAEASASARDVSARLANRVAETLESKCQLPAGRASAIVRGQPSTTSAKLELAVDATP